jgi:hypothetical protein
MRISLTLSMTVYIGEAVDWPASISLAAEETVVPMDRFRSASFDE